MTNANELLRAIVLQFIFILGNGFMVLDDVQNGHHSEKQAYVGQYFKERIDFGPELLCNVSRVQVSDAYSHEQPSWLILETNSRLLYGIPQENEIGSVILFLTALGKNADGQEFICSKLVWKVTIELDPNTLLITISQHIENRTIDQQGTDVFQRCLYHPSVIIATLSIGVRLATPTRRQPLAILANLIAESFNFSNEVIQVVHSSSSITFQKQLRSLKILRYERFLDPKLENNLYHVSWPLGCDHDHFDFVDIHRVHRRSISDITDLNINNWHLTSGHISGEVLARKRRAVFFGSITALEGTPLETSILPTKILTSAIFTLTSSVEGTHSFRSARVTSSPSLNSSSAIRHTRSTNAGSGLTPLPTAKPTSFVLSASYQANVNNSSPFSRHETSSTSLFTTSIVASSHRTPSLEPYSSQSFRPTLVSFSSVLRESTYGPFLSPSLLGSSFGATLSSLAYFTSSISYPQSVQSTCSSGVCVNESTSLGPLGGSSIVKSLATDASSLINSSSIMHQTRNSSYSLSFLQSETATFGVTMTDTTNPSFVFSSIRTPYYTSIMPPSFAPTPRYTSVVSVPTSLSSAKIVLPLFSTASSYSLQYPVTLSYSTPYKLNSTEMSTVVPKVPRSTASIFASIGDSNSTVQTMAMQSASILPSIKTFYAEFSSSHFLESVTSSSVRYQKHSTEISEGISMALSSVASSVISSRGAFIDASSRTVSILFTSIFSLASSIASKSSPRYTGIPSLSATRKLNSTGTSNVVSLISASVPTASSIKGISHTASQPTTVQLPFSSSTPAASSVRTDISYLSSQTTTTQLLSVLPSTDKITTSQYSKRSVASTAPVTFGDTITKVTASLAFQSIITASAYSLIPLLSSSRPTDSSGNVSMISKTIAQPSLLTSSLFIVKSAILSPSETEHLSFGLTNSPLSYIKQSVKPTPSNFVLTTDTVVTSVMKERTSGIFPSSKVPSITNVVSPFGRSYSSAMLPSQSEVIDASLHSPIVAMSSGFLLASSYYSSETISTLQSTLMQHTTILGSTQKLGVSTVVPASSDLKTYPSLSLASHFINLTLQSAPTQAFNINSSVVATQIPNTSPTLVNSIGRVTAYVGRLLTFSVPFDTFYDKESGYTPNLVVTCRHANGKPLEKSFWIVYNNMTQTFTGLPLLGEYRKQDSGGARLEVLASDQFGNTAGDVFSVHIENTAVDIQFALSARISRQFQEFQTDSSLKVALFDRIIRFYNTSSTRSYYATSLTNGSVLFAWSDTTVSGTSCNTIAITQLASSVRAPSGSVTSRFAQAMLPDFPVLGVTLNYLGVCSTTPTTSAAPIGPATGERTGDIFTRFVVPTVAAAAVLALIIGAFIFLSKRRRSKPSFLEKRTFRKGRPVLLPEEYELDGIKSPVVSLPEDYVFSNAGDRHSVYSRRLSDNEDEDDKVYMDNPLYGLSEFKKPPPAYNRETDVDEVESDYESPYERLPPSYQLPPLYVDQDLMTSEV